MDLLQCSQQSCAKKRKKRIHCYGVGYHPKSNPPFPSCRWVAASLPSLPPKKTGQQTLFCSAGTVTKNRPFLQGKWHQRDDPRARDETIGEILGCTFTSSKCPRSYEDDFAAWSSVLFKRGWKEVCQSSIPRAEVLGTSGVFHMNGICQDLYMKQVLLPIFHVGRLLSPNMTVPKPGNLWRFMVNDLVFSEDFRILKGDSGIPYFIIKETIWLRWPMFQVGEIQKWFNLVKFFFTFFSPPNWGRWSRTTLGIFLWDMHRSRFFFSVCKIW